jgi:glycosyltransferase involved in cell wall biosynthesis
MNDKIKIGYLYYGDPTDTKYWSGTVSNLHKIISKSNKVELVDIVVKPHWLSSRLYKAVRVLSRRKNEISFLAAVLNSREANSRIIEADCDFIFAPACSKLIYSGRKALKNKKLIYLSDATYHNMIDYYFFHSKHDQKIADMWERTAHSLASAVIFPAEWSFEDAINYYHTPKERIKLLKFGANIEDVGFKIIKPGKEKYKLLLIGVDYVRKGVDIAIETVKFLNETSATVKYELTVVGLNKPDIDIPDYVNFMGKLRKDREDELNRLIDCYKSHDIFILPTKAECSAIVFSEASMFGLPVFTYATGGTTDYVQDGVSGRCLNSSCGATDFAKAITNAVENGDVEKFSIGARKKYEEELNWNIWLEKFESVIEEQS